MKRERFKDYDSLPLVLDVSDIQQVMGISRVSAYGLVHTPGFPAFRSGRRRELCIRQVLSVNPACSATQRETEGRSQGVCQTAWFSYG